MGSRRSGGMAEIKVNLGCGLNAVDGWHNFDRSPNLMLVRVPMLRRSLRRLGLLSDAHMAAWPRNVRRHDIRRPLPFGDRTVDAIYTSHTLEHLYLDEARLVLRECERVLRAGGVIRLAMPDAEQLARDLLDGVAVGGGDPGEAFNRNLNAHPLARPTMKHRVVALFASGPHRWQPTLSLLSALLAEAGFAEVRQCAFREGRSPDLASVEHREQSVFVEARAHMESWPTAPERHVNDAGASATS